MLYNEKNSICCYLKTKHTLIYEGFIPSLYNEFTCPIMISIVIWDFWAACSNDSQQKKKMKIEQTNRKTTW